MTLTGRTAWASLAVDSETVSSRFALSVAISLLCSACGAEWPATSVRIFNPLALGDFADVSCPAILGAGVTTAEARAALTSEPIGRAQQEWSILGLGCSLFVLGVSSFLHAGCDTPSAENSKRCHDVTNWGFGALGAVCAFL